MNQPESGTTNSSSNAMDVVQATKASLLTLQARKQAMEVEMEAIVAELQAPTKNGGPPMGVATPLVDADGYPRADIDVYRARTLRGRLAVLQTDHRTVRQELDAGLQRLAAVQNATTQPSSDDAAELLGRQRPKPKPKYDAVTGKWVVQNWDGSVAGIPGGETRSFANLQETTSTTTPVRAPPPPPASRSTFTPPRRPFARINSVDPQSPAQQAGLQVDDLVLQFGQVTMDRGGLAAVPPVVRSQASIDIVVQRSQQKETVTLHPRSWGGRGLLGCHIVPYSTEPGES